MTSQILINKILFTILAIISFWSITTINSVQGMNNIIYTTTRDETATRTGICQPCESAINHNNNNNKNNNHNQNNNNNYYSQQHQQEQQEQPVSKLYIPTNTKTKTIYTTTSSVTPNTYNTNNNNNNNINYQARVINRPSLSVNPPSYDSSPLSSSSSSLSSLSPSYSSLSSASRIISNAPSGSSVSTSGSHGVTNGGTTTYYTDYVSDSSSGQGCSRSPCGVSALCQETIGGRPVCSCPAGHSGNPLTYCRRAECLDHSECRGDMSCRNGNCVNPCVGTCGSNANCEVRNHVPVCSCPAGYKGDPFSYCNRADPEEACHPTPCGQNTNCEVVNGVPTCSCIKGFTGSPLSGCRHECESDGECGAQESCQDFRCQSACASCGQGATCTRVQNHRAVCDCPKGYIGSAYTECRPECYGDRDCPTGRPACYYGICKNPCDGACGTGADCNLRGLTPVCSCPRDMTGDPFISCRPFTKEDLCSPNPCGTNAQCNPGYDNTHRERPVCTCFAGYTGNPLSHCARGECQSDSECGDHRACINYQCVNPCVGQCGAGATCEPKRHLAVCKCPEGRSGDALVSCTQSRSFPVARYH